MALAMSVPRETAALQAQMPYGLLVPDARNDIPFGEAAASMPNARTVSV
jgi:hypothetical protein